MREEYIKFYPVLLVWPIWIYTVITQNLWSDIFSTYWPATIGMIFGSFIAGSTPLGGGVVAFPIAVLILNFSSSESRDASILVQSIGMNAATFLLITTKSYLLHKPMIYINIIFGSCGMMMGLSFNESPELTNLIYTITVLCFGIIYFYTNIIDTNQNTKKKQIANDITFKLDEYRDILTYIIMIIFAIIGGFITASVGSGSDIAVFIFGIYVWNIIYPDLSLDDNIFTASSVVVMGIMSALSVGTRALSQDLFTNKVMLCFAAMSFVVVLGAPIGSLVLTPKNLKFLQYLFYALSIIQFILFGILKIKNNLKIWILNMIIIMIVVILLTIHYVCKKYKNKNKNKNKNDDVNAKNYQFQPVAQHSGFDLVTNDDANINHVQVVDMKIND